MWIHTSCRIRISPGCGAACGIPMEENHLTRLLWLMNGTCLEHKWTINHHISSIDQECRAQSRAYASYETNDRWDHFRSNSRFIMWNLSDYPYLFHELCLYIKTHKDSCIFYIYFPNTINISKFLIFQILKIFYIFPKRVIVEIGSWRKTLHGRSVKYITCSLVLFNFAVVNLLQILYQVL